MEPTLPAPVDSDAQSPLLVAEAITEPRGLLGPLNDLLTQPLAVVHRARRGMGFAPLRLLGGAVACSALYGAAAGFFMGGDQILVSAFKAPLIVALSLLLCLPSLYVFSALAGARWSWRAFLAVTAGFAGTLGLLLAGLLPIVWLFSLSSRHLAAVTWIHVFLWVLALLVGWRFLRRALAANGTQSGLFLWVLLFCIVSFQVTTFLRPVLWHPTGTALFRTGEKMSFFEHLGSVFDEDDRREETRRKAEKRKKEEEAKKAAGKKDGGQGAKPAPTPTPPAR